MEPLCRVHSSYGNKSIKKHSWAGLLETKTTRPSVVIQTCAVEEGCLNKHFRPTMINMTCLQKAKEHTFMFEFNAMYACIPAMYIFPGNAPDIRFYTTYYREGVVTVHIQCPEHLGRCKSVSYTYSNYIHALLPDQWIMTSTVTSNPHQM